MTAIDFSHVNGVPWWEAAIPPRWHRCKSQTEAWDGPMHVRRCACGSISLDGRHWMEKNSTRKSRRRRRAS